MKEGICDVCGKKGIFSTWHTGRNQKNALTKFRGVWYCAECLNPDYENVYEGMRDSAIADCERLWKI